MSTIKVLVAVLLVVLGLIAVQHARGRAGQIANRPRAVELLR